MIAPGLLALLSPIVATILGAFVVGDAFTPMQSIGFCMAATALVVGQMIPRPGRTRTTMPAPTVTPR